MITHVRHRTSSLQSCDYTDERRVLAKVHLGRAQFRVEKTRFPIAHVRRRFQRFGATVAICIFRRFQNRLAPLRLSPAIYEYLVHELQSRGSSYRLGSNFATRRRHARDVKTDWTLEKHTHAHNVSLAASGPAGAEGRGGDEGARREPSATRSYVHAPAGICGPRTSAGFPLFPSFRPEDSKIETRKRERPPTPFSLPWRSLALPDALRLKLNRGSLLPRGPLATTN